MRKIPRCNVKLCRKKEDVVDDEGGSEEGERVSVNEGSEEGEKVSVNEESEKGENVSDQDFGEGIKKKYVEEINRMRTRSMDREKKRDLELDDVSTFWLKTENNECYDEIATYTVEIPAEDK